jgi:hypothetical protein
VELHAHRDLLGKIDFIPNVPGPGVMVRDLYDLAMTQFGPRFIIGDVKGKGLDAAGRCAAVLAVFRELAFGEPGPAGHRAQAR